MVELNREFNTEDNADTIEDFSPIPIGSYAAEIVKSEIVPTKAGTGERLNFTFQILEGKYKGRKVIEGLNISNPNPKAEEIAHKQLNTLCVACDKIGVSDTEDLHNTPIIIKVGLNPANAQYSASNKVTFFSPYTEDFEVDADLQTAPAETAPAETAAKREKPSWAKQ